MPDIRNLTVKSLASYVETRRKLTRRKSPSGGINLSFKWLILNVIKAAIYEFIYSIAISLGHKIRDRRRDGENE